MSLVSPRTLFSQQSAVLGLNVILLEHAEAFVSAAEESNQGLILQLSQRAVEYHGALAPIGNALLSMARLSKVPIAVMLDHATNTELCDEAMGLGFTSIMFDGSTAEHSENVANTKEVVDRAKKLEIFIEAELGEIGGKDGAHAPGIRTNPDQAREFVSETGVDALAVAVGSSHAMTNKSAELDFDLIAQLRNTVAVPLVLHGSSGVALGNLTKAVKSGIRKINIGTEFNILLTKSIRQELSKNPDIHDPRKYLVVAREQIKNRTKEYLAAFSFEGNPN